ncbi:Peptidase S8, subtilisin-related like protein, partial [Aduncisulcus paluster]
TQGVKAVYRVNEYERPEPDMKYSGEYVNLDKALNYRNGKYDGRGTVVAVIDSGVDYNHKDMRLDYPENAKLSENAVTARIHDNNLGGKYFTEKVPYGYNYFDKNDQVIDKGDGASMHGMHVAGTVAANGNDEGINGIAPEAQVLA